MLARLTRCSARFLGFECRRDRAHFLSSDEITEAIATQQERVACLYRMRPFKIDFHFGVWPQ